jgi:hypothetical protein
MRRYLIFASAALSLFMYAIDGTAVAVAFPHLLMPSRVATITGLRGMFRYVGGAVGISLTTLVLHISPDPASGFRATFFAFGLALLATLPLVFLMPSGRQAAK